MRNPTFFVGRPDDWIRRRPERMVDIIPFYEQLLNVLEEKGYQYKLGGIKTAPTTHDICLAHHTNVTRPNVWNIKRGYFPNYLNWDRCGYSGWAEMANSKELFDKTQTVDLEEATAGVNAFAEDYIQKNISKFPQTSGGVKIKDPYVFVACQRPRDTVAALARVDTLTLAETVARQAAGTGYKVVIKRHPMEKQFNMNHLQSIPHVIFSDHSIHELIPNSSAVFTVNSGVGLETLLHNKPVYTSGKSDYEWVTRKIINKQDIKTALDNITPLTQEETERAVKFMHYMLTEHFVNVTDINSIRKKVDMCVDEWRNK